MQNIENVVLNFRESIVELVRVKSLPRLSTFPRGCCNDSAFLLGTYLDHNGFGEFEAVGACSSTEGNGTTHSWLEKGDLVIDITRSQFSGNISNVYIGNSPEWYGDWVVKQRLSAQIFNERLALASTYNKIVDNIKEINRLRLD